MTDTDEERRFHARSLLPPLAIGAYSYRCPVCLAGPGEWCRARFTLPREQALREPHRGRSGLVSPAPGHDD